MTVYSNLDRQAREISYDPNLVKGDTIEIRCVNPNVPEGEDGHVSTRTADNNDGLAVITFPADYSGTCEITVTGSESGVDTGTIEV